MQHVKAQSTTVALFRCMTLEPICVSTLRVGIYAKEGMLLIFHNIVVHADVIKVGVEDLVMNLD